MIAHAATMTKRDIEHTAGTFDGTAGIAITFNATNAVRLDTIVF